MSHHDLLPYLYDAKLRDQVTAEKSGVAPYVYQSAGDTARGNGLASLRSFFTRARSLFLGATFLASALGSLALVDSADAATLKVAYSLDYIFSKPELATKWFEGVKKQFEAAHPGDTMELTAIPGGYQDFITKLSLLYNSPSTAPDIVQYMSESTGQFAEGGLFLAVDDRLKNEKWWQETPQPVQQAGSVDGATYGIPQGINTYGLLFDRTIFKKAGLAADWNPTNWNDILEAARAIKKAQPDSWPIWLITGTAQGSSSLVNGPGLLLAASSEPTIFDTKTKKWVVDSKGIREVLNFYKQTSKEGLLAPSSQIMDANATNNSATILPKHNTGIVFAGNWIPIDWSDAVCTPCWSHQDQEAIGFAKMPTSAGQAPQTIATFGGVELAIYKNTSNPDLAWSAVNIMQQSQNMLTISQWVPTVPSVPSLAQDPAYLNVSLPRFQTSFAELSSVATSMPALPVFPVWAYAFQDATQTMVLKPDTSVDDAVQKLTKYMTDQVGADQIETLP